MERTLPRWASRARLHTKLDLSDNLSIRLAQAWGADLTYVWTDEGWLYLAIVLALFNREIVGWSIKPRMTAGIVTNALTMAWFRRAGSDSPFGSGQPARTQLVVATRTSFAERSTLLMASDGVSQPSVLRGLVLRVRATAARSAGPCALRSVPLGKYCRNSLFVFSFVPTESVTTRALRLTGWIPPLAANREYPGGVQASALLQPTCPPVSSDPRH